MLILKTRASPLNYQRRNSIQSLDINKIQELDHVNSGEQRRDLVACIQFHLSRARADFFAISCDLPLKGVFINEKGIPARSRSLASIIIIIA